MCTAGFISNAVITIGLVVPLERKLGGQLFAATDQTLDIILLQELRICHLISLSLLVSILLL